MAKTKTFKSVTGYLRGQGEILRYNLPQRAEQRIAAVTAGQRAAINNMLPQLGINQRIGADEAPIAVVERLLALGGAEPQVKALQTCQRWSRIL